MHMDLKRRVIALTIMSTQMDLLTSGKAYDYVFNIDIQEGAPPLKLPFNVTEDPWLAAQQFLDRNDLSQMFLDQVTFPVLLYFSAFFYRFIVRLY